MPFPDNYFDIVFNDGVLEHLQNFKKAFGEMVRITKPGGKIIVAVPNWLCFPHTIYKKIVGKRFEYGYEKSFKREELIGLFEEFGLKNLEITGFNPAHSIQRLSRYFYPMYWIGWLIDRLIIVPMDKLTNNMVSNIFGIEICVKGVK